jgi:chorismate synthase
MKYGIRDFRGGGRSSARETAMRVAAGAVARKLLPGVTIRGALVQMGTEKIDRAKWDWEEVDRNPFFTPDLGAVQGWAAYLDEVRKKGSSCGAIVEVVAEGVPAGLGAPIYGKLDQDIAAALMSINAVKGVEIGAGFASACFSGEENADEMRIGPGGKPIFLSNHAGGILGGISTGQPVVARFAVKPTSSILSPRRTVDNQGQDTDIQTKGRHDPCVGIRAVPVGEAMVALVLADHFLRHRGQTGR